MPPNLKPPVTLLQIPINTLHLITSHILRSHGILSTSSVAQQTLTSVLHNYLLQLSRACVDEASAAGRGKPEIWDVVNVLDHWGVGVNELAEWREGDWEGRGGWAMSERVLVDGLEELKNLVLEGRPPAPAEPLEFQYRPIPSSPTSSSASSPDGIDEDTSFPIEIDSAEIDEGYESLTEEAGRSANGLTGSISHHDRPSSPSSSRPNKRARRHSPERLSSPIIPPWLPPVPELGWSRSPELEGGDLGTPGFEDAEGEAEARPTGLTAEVKGKRREVIPAELDLEAAPKQTPLQAYLLPPKSYAQSSLSEVYPASHLSSLQARVLAAKTLPPASDGSTLAGGIPLPVPSTLPSLTKAYDVAVVEADRARLFGYRKRGEREVMRAAAAIIGKTTNHPLAYSGASVTHGTGSASLFTSIQGGGNGPGGKGSRVLPSFPVWSEDNSRADGPGGWPVAGLKIGASAGGYVPTLAFGKDMGKKGIVNPSVNWGDTSGSNGVLHSIVQELPGKDTVKVVHESFMSNGVTKIRAKTERTTVGSANGRLTTEVLESRATIMPPIMINQSVEGGDGVGLYGEGITAPGWVKDMAIFVPDLDRKSAVAHAAGKGRVGADKTLPGALQRVWRPTEADVKKVASSITRKYPFESRGKGGPNVGGRKGKGKDRGLGDEDDDEEMIPERLDLGLGINDGESTGPPVEEGVKLLPKITLRSTWNINERGNPLLWIRPKAKDRGGKVIVSKKGDQLEFETNKEWVEIDEDEDDDDERETNAGGSGGEEDVPERPGTFRERSISVSAVSAGGDSSGGPKKIRMSGSLPSQPVTPTGTPTPKLSFRFGGHPTPAIGLPGDVPHSSPASAQIISVGPTVPAGEDEDEEMEEVKPGSGTTPPRPQPGVAAGSATMALLASPLGHTSTQPITTPIQTDSPEDEEMEAVDIPVIAVPRSSQPSTGGGFKLKLNFKRSSAMDTENAGYLSSNATQQAVVTNPGSHIAVDEAILAVAPVARFDDGPTLSGRPTGINDDVDMELGEIM